MMFTSTNDGHAGTQEPGENRTDNIIDILHETRCSNRLVNRIMSQPHDLPINTAREYMKNPWKSRQAFLEMPKLGLKSANELDQIIRDFMSNFIPPENDPTPKNDPEIISRAIGITETLFSEISYPDELFECSPTTRLRRLLEPEKKKSLVDFLKTWDETISRMLLLPNCGKKTIKELDQLIFKIMRNRLETFNAKGELATGFRSLLSGEFLSQELLCDIFKLEDIKSDHIKEIKNAELDNKTVDEIITGSISLLDDRLQDILYRRYSLKGNKYETLESIANDYNMTRERIRQLENDAKQKLATKRTKKTLTLALTQTEIIDKLFNERKIIRWKQKNHAGKLLTAWEHLAIDLVYGNLKSFLDSETIQVKTGWTRKKDYSFIQSLNNQSEEIPGTFKYQLISVIRNQQYPLRLSKIADSLPDWSPSEIKDKLSQRYKATFDGDVIKTIPELPISVKCILILRNNGSAMHSSEIKNRIHQMFGKETNLNLVENTLSRVDKILIVGRGTFNLYENLNFQESDLKEIRNRIFNYLKTVGGFVSAKIIYSRLFLKKTEQFHSETDFGYYMLLGIVKHDSRFDNRHGLMIGLATDENKSRFTSLSQDVMSILEKAEQPMTSIEIANELAERRDLFSNSVWIILKNSPDVIMTDNRRFVLKTRAKGTDDGNSAPSQ